MLPDMLARKVSEKWVLLNPKGVTRTGVADAVGGVGDTAANQDGGRNTGCWRDHDDVVVTKGASDCWINDRIRRVEASNNYAVPIER